MGPQMTLKRKELARAAGINPETLRFYEKVGLLPKPTRADNGYRIYSQATVSRLQFIQEIKDLGFTLKEIQTLLSLRAKSAVSCRSSASVARKKLQELDAKIEAMRRVRRKLSKFLERCESQPNEQDCGAFTLLDG